MHTDRGIRLCVLLLLPLHLEEESGEELVCFQQNTQPSHCLLLAAVQLPGMLLLTRFSHFLLHVALLGTINDQETIWQGQSKVSGR